MRAASWMAVVNSCGASHGTSMPSNPVTLDVLRDAKVEFPRGEHHPGREQVRLAHDRRGLARVREGEMARGDAFLDHRGPRLDDDARLDPRDRRTPRGDCVRAPRPRPRTGRDPTTWVSASSLRGRVTVAIRVCPSLVRCARRATVARSSSIVTSPAPVGGGTLHDRDGDPAPSGDLEAGIVVRPHAHQDRRVHRRGLEERAFAVLAPRRGDEEHPEAHVAERADDAVHDVERVGVPERPAQVVSRARRRRCGFARSGATCRAGWVRRSRGPRPPSPPVASSRRRSDRRRRT